MAYATAADLAARADPTGSWIAADTTLATALLASVSRLIEEYCGRDFTVVAQAETRYYTPTNGAVVEIDDCRSVSALYTDVSGNRDYGLTWASTDYDLMPLTSAYRSAPYTEIVVSPRGRYSFDAGMSRSVKVTGLFGWPAIPTPVFEATLMEAGRMLPQTQSPSGVVASAELGRFIVLPQLHPTSKILLAPFRRMRVAAA